MPREAKNTEDGSGRAEAVKLPDCEVVTFLPEAKSAAEQELPCPGLRTVQK
jgi:hypothetical protein